MNVQQPVEMGEGIFVFQGRTPNNLLLRPISAHAYLLEDGEEVILFDPSCGKSVASGVEAHIRSRQQAGVQWEKAFLIAGHSHMDHANNFYLSDIVGAPETRVYVHEKGFQYGKVNNGPVAFIEDLIGTSNRYYDFYRSFPYCQFTGLTIPC